MTDDEAQMAGEKNMRHSHATHDLYNHIGSGKSANWVRCLFKQSVSLSGKLFLAKLTPPAHLLTVQCTAGLLYPDNGHC